jgi:hypothetical protein
MFNSIFSQILGGLGGTAGAGAAGGASGVNPFSGFLGSAAGLVGGPASTGGTLMSLPGETLTGIADLGTSKNILGDIAGLANPAMNLGDKALGGAGGNLLSALNPFGSGGEGNGRLGGIIPHHYLPLLGMGALIAALESPQKEEY